MLFHFWTVYFTAAHYRLSPSQCLALAFVSNRTWDLGTTAVIRWGDVDVMRQDLISPLQSLRWFNQDISLSVISRTSACSFQIIQIPWIPIKYVSPKQEFLKTLADVVVYGVCLKGVIVTILIRDYNILVFIGHSKKYR